jgi:hypothetical protein
LKSGSQGARTLSADHIDIVCGMITRSAPIHHARSGLLSIPFRFGHNWRQETASSCFEIGFKTCGNLLIQAG